MTPHLVRAEDPITLRMELLGIAPNRKQADAIVELHRHGAGADRWRYTVVECNANDKTEDILFYHIDLLNDRIESLTSTGDAK